MNKKQEHGLTDGPTVDAEAELRKKNLELETKLLSQQLHPKYRMLEAAKAVAGSLAIFGVVVTLYLGVSQLGETHRSNDDERFDKAVARLASSTPTERLAGVVGLGLYLEPRQKPRHRATLRFLVNALAAEQDPVVRGELLDRLSQLTLGQISQDDLNDALERLRDRNISLYARLHAAFMYQVLHGTAHLADKGNDETEVGAASEDDLAPLRATASALTALIKNGARAKNLSGVYWVRCDFSGKIWDMTNPDFSKVADFAHADPTKTLDLSGADFHGAILRNANFLGVNLRETSFDGADLTSTNFAGADLSNAKLTDFGRRHYIIQGMETSGHLSGGMFPDFTCADLSGADFSGSILFAIYASSPPNPAYAILHNANLTNTKLEQMDVLTASRVSPNYNPTPPERMSTFLFEGYRQAGEFSDIKDWDEQPNIVELFWGSPQLRIREPISADYRLGIQLVFSNLASARNLDKSELPQRMKDFISRNQKSLAQSPHPTPCTPKS
jgi:uncharacterized protein YjbI with pentapeptide repeats